VDTEADSLHSYFDKVCLIQISIPGEDLIVDPLKRLDLGRFGALLAERGVQKVLHGADYDLRILNRDFGYTIANVVDTSICAQLLGYEGIGLAALLERHFGIQLDKSHQPSQRSRFGRDIVRIVHEALALDEDALPQKAESRLWARDKTLESRVNKLKAARDKVVKELKIDPAVLAPRHVLTAVAEA